VGLSRRNAASGEAETAHTVAKWNRDNDNEKIFLLQQIYLVPYTGK
jgi:hypothetical protein